MVFRKFYAMVRNLYDIYETKRLEKRIEEVKMKCAEKYEGLKEYLNRERSYDKRKLKKVKEAVREASEIYYNNVKNRNPIILPSGMITCLKGHNIIIYLIGEEAKEELCKGKGNDKKMTPKEVKIEVLRRIADYCKKEAEECKKRAYIRFREGRYDDAEILSRESKIYSSTARELYEKIYQEERPKIFKVIEYARKVINKIF